MKDAKLKAMIVANEINLNKISEYFGINKKFRWDETLVLSSARLKGIISEPDGKQVSLFSFGSAIFFNLTFHEINDVIKYLSKIEKSIETRKRIFEDDYEIIIASEEQNVINSDYIILQELKSFHFEIISTVLAKSVALDKIETEIDLLMDDLEELVKLLDKGELKLPEQHLAKIWSKILGFKYNTVSYLMLLDKPEITWDNDEAEKLFEKMSKLFELKFRYDIIAHKTEVLKDIVHTFGDLSQTKKGNRLEWIIIILISFEILFPLSEKIIAFLMNIFGK